MSHENSWLIFQIPLDFILTVTFILRAERRFAV